MPLDAITLTHLTQELNNRLEGARVDKVHMPNRYEIVLALRAREGNVRLLLSANPVGSRLQITCTVRENPQEPPMFCMLMRKHFSGARLKWVRQEPLERIVRLCFEAVGDLGDLEQKELVLELTGRPGNLIVLDEQQRVLQALHYSDITEGAGRHLIPGVLYQLPKRPDKLDVTEGFDALRHCLEGAGQQAGDTFLVQHIMGLSPMLARECLHRTCGSVDRPISDLTSAQRVQLFDELTSLFTGQEASPTLLLDQDDTPADFSCTHVEQYGSLYRVELRESYSQLLDEFYEKRDRQARQKQLRASLEKLIKAGLERISKKISAQQAELQSFRDREQLRIFGELLTANLHLVQRGAAFVSLPNYYDDQNATVTIPLDIRISPSANAQLYFKRYQKAKNGERILKEQLEHGKLDLSYLQSVLYALQQAQTEREVAEIRAELIHQGILPTPKGGKGHGGKRQQKTPESGQPLTFISTDGFPILVGRNNTQNDLLVSRIGLKDDWWLHVLGLAGSHVLVQSQGRSVPDSTLTQAAQLAALFSSASTSDAVSVTYTRLRNVKKPSGAKPGYVIYTTSQTAYIKSDPTLPHQLRMERS